MIYIMKKVRLSDIAKKANSSISAVSLALNNKQGVSKRKADEIITIAHEMGYILPEEILQKNNSSIRLMMIINHGRILNPSHNPFLADYMFAVEVKAKELGYSVIFQSIDINIYKQAMADFEKSAESGLIIIGTELDLEFFLSFTCKKPVVFIDTYYPQCNFDFIDMNNHDIVWNIVEYLKDFGHKNIGFIQSSVLTGNFIAREVALKDATSYFDIKLEPQNIFRVDPTYKGSHNELKKEFENLKTFPTAFFCSNDILAIGCINALTGRKISIPEDISIIGFDNLPLAEAFSPALTSVKVKKIEIGSKAVDLLHRKLTDPSNMTSEKTLVSNKLIKRNSVLNISE